MPPPETTASAAAAAPAADDGFAASLADGWSEQVGRVGEVVRPCRCTRRVVGGSRGERPSSRRRAAHAIATIDLAVGGSGTGHYGGTQIDAGATIWSERRSTPAFQSLITVASFVLSSP